MIGLLGGMGPLSTAHFFKRLVELTPAATDQDHVPVVVWSDPRVPDRVRPITERTEPSPLPAMRAGVEGLERAGATAIAIVCHTAHHWYDDLARSIRVPLLHIAEAALAELPDADGAVGLLATRGTLASGFYQRRLAARSRSAILPADGELDELIEPGIRAVKRGDTASGRASFARAGEGLRARGASVVLLACTEVSAAWPADAGITAVDATDALARACIRSYVRERTG